MRRSRAGRRGHRRTPAPDRTGQARSGGFGEPDARVGVAAVAEGVLGEVLLVLVLGVVVLRRRGDLGGDVAEAAAGQLVAVDLGQVAGGLLLLRGRVVDRGAVLGADVVALAHALGRVVDLEEPLHQVGVGDDGGVEDDPDGLGVAGPAGAHLFVRRVRGVAAGVADGGRVDPGDLPVDLLGAPEAAEAEDGDLEALGHLVGDHGSVQDLVARGDREVARGAARQGLVGVDQLGLVAGEHASILPGHASSGQEQEQPLDLGRYGGPTGAEVLARVGQILVAQRLADRGREDVVEVGRDVDLRHAGGDGADQPGVGHAGRAVQHQRHRHGLGQLGDQAVVELRVAGGHRVRRPDGDGQRVDPGRRDELRGLGRTGAHPRRVYAVLAADLAELGLDRHPALAAPADDVGGGREVGGVVERGAVVHHGRDAELDRLVDQVDAGGVVEMDADLDGRGARRSPARRPAPGRSAP